MEDWLGLKDRVIIVTGGNTQGGQRGAYSSGSGAYNPGGAGGFRSGILAACHKRPVSAADIESIVNKVSQAVYNSMQEEVTTRKIGEMIMEELRQLDEVAYIRFASVYRQFADLSTFLAEMTKMKEEAK